MDFSDDIGNIHYLDNAATVFPKPPEILKRMLDLYLRYGVNPGRSGYDLCLVGGEILYSTRKRLTEFFGGTVPEHLCFTANASDSLNILIQGMVGEGDHVITTTLEHNSVIRPLNHLREEGLISVDYLPTPGDGRVDPEDLRKKIRSNTRLMVVNHGSNVIGTIQPIAEIGHICREHDVLFLVDAAQTAGIIPINIGEMSIDALAFTGHKSLLGPTGIGGLYVGDGVEVRQTRFGGTGVRSAHPFHLDDYPYRLEVGTNNILGVTGLYLAQEYIQERGIETIYRHEMALFRRLQEGIQEIRGVELHGTRSLEHRLPVLSLTIQGSDPSQVGTFLDIDHGIACRTGLQCAPLIHQEMGTAPRGTVRLSIGPMNTEADIEAAIVALEEVASDLRVLPPTTVV